MSRSQTLGRIEILDLNSLITCVLCSGYYIDATTISECLHSFCRTCIVSYLQSNKYCPICDVQVHKTKPLSSIRADQTLQDIVYKLVPGLFKNEMQRRRDFYSTCELTKKYCLPISGEKRGDVSGCERLIFTPEDIISISLEYCPPNLSFPMLLPTEQGHMQDNEVLDMVIPKNGEHRRYLQCPGAFSVYHIKKFIYYKYDLPATQDIDVMYMHDHLRNEYTLTDLAYIYSWRRNGPIRLFYKIRSATINKKPDALPADVMDTLPVSHPMQLGTKIQISTPGVTIAAAPTSQSHLQHPPSPPPSPQTACEPDDINIVMAKQPMAILNNCNMSDVCSRTADIPQNCSLLNRSSSPNFGNCENSKSDKRISSNYPYSKDSKCRNFKLSVMNLYNGNVSISPKSSTVNGLKKELSPNNMESSTYRCRENHMPGFQHNKRKASLANISPSGKMKAANMRFLHKNSL